LCTGFIRETVEVVRELVQLPCSGGPLSAMRTSLLMDKLLRLRGIKLEEIIYRRLFCKNEKSKFVFAM
jgi:hypothetical protein